MWFIQKIHYIKHEPNGSSVWEQTFWEDPHNFTVSSIKEDSKNAVSEILQKGENIAYIAPIKYAQKHSDMFSQINSNTKKSLWYYNCLALVGTWHQQDGMPISLLWHIDSRILYQIPWFFSKPKEISWTLKYAREHLEPLLKSFNQQVKVYKDFSFTIHWWNNVHFENESIPPYDIAVKVLQNLVKKHLKQNATIGSSKNTTWPSHIVIDTPNETVHVLRDDGMKRYDI